MKRVATLAVCLAGGLLWHTRLHAGEATTLSGNPYAVVVVRNVFGLNPPPLVDPNAKVVEPPVKITPNGIMSIFGQLQALFKVAAKPPAKEDASYILAEGQSQDDIEVVKINEKDGVITFNNHGIVQDLPLEKPSASATSTPAPGGKPGQPGFRPGFTPGAGPGGGAGGNPFSRRFGARGGNNGGNPDGNPNADPSLGNGPTSSPTYIQREESPLTPDEAAVAMEVNRELTKQQVIEGSIPPLPPTELTPDDATGPGGGPLVAPAPGAPK